jgi:hypothetical protein
MDCIVPCPKCGKTDGRDYSAHLNWVDSEESMERLLNWVKRSPCNACSAKKDKQKKG